MGNTRDLLRWGHNPSGATPSVKRSARLHVVRRDCTMVEGLVLTDAITPPTKLCRKDSAWFQNLLGTADDTDRIPFAPMQNGVAKDLVELTVLEYKLGRKLIVQRLDILDIRVFQPVFLCLVDLQLQMRNVSRSAERSMRLPCSDWNLCPR